VAVFGCVARPRTQGAAARCAGACLRRGERERDTCARSAETNTLSSAADIRMADFCGFSSTSFLARCLTQPPRPPCLLCRYLSRVYFWGKMQGVQRDYLIAQGLGDSAGDKKKEAENAGSEMTVARFFDTLQAVPKKTFRLGPDGVSWTILPTVTPEMTALDASWKKSIQAKGQVFTPLTGDISYKYEFTTLTGPPAEGDEEKKPTPEAKEMVEDVRLACMVDDIDAAASVIPVGSFILNSSSRVVVNPYFRGLDLSAGLKLESYLHLRKPLQLQAEILKS
jgi:hypothetical protein